MDPFLFSFFNIVFSLFILFLFLNSLKYNFLLSSVELKWSFNLFILFFSSNFITLFGYFLSISVWPFILVYTSFFLWCQSILNLFSESILILIEHFCQKKLNFFMSLIMVFVELLSNSIRFVTLSFRLLANIIGGHLMMELIYPMNIGVFFLFFYEFFVCLVQAIIFNILACNFNLETVEKF